MIREGFPRTVVNFPNAAIGGSPPFSFGFNWGVSEDSGDLALVTAAVVAWWEADTTVLGYLDSALGAPTVTSTGVYGGIVLEDAALTVDPPTGSVSDLVGVSVRMLMNGNRPVGGRRGCFYVPGVEGTTSDGAGIVNATYRTNFSAWGESLRTAIEGAFAGAFLATLHTVDSVESESAITNVACAPTVSFLNRRYR